MIVYHSRSLGVIRGPDTRYPLEMTNSDEVASLVSYPVSDEASTVTGATVSS